MNYFYNEFGKNNVFYVDTHLIGTLNNFTTYNLKLVDKNQSEIIGTANFKNLLVKEIKSFIWMETLIALHPITKI